MIHLSALRDAQLYFVIRDDSRRESIMLSGAAIKASWTISHDIQRFKAAASIQMPGYVRCQCPEGTLIGLWMNPRCPELADPDVVPPFVPKAAVESVQVRPAQAASTSELVTGAVRQAAEHVATRLATTGTIND